MHKATRRYADGDYKKINAKIADCHSCLAFLSKDKKIAAEHHEKAASRFRTANDLVRVGQQHELAGDKWLSLGERNRARENFHKAAEDFRQAHLTDYQYEEIRVQQKILAQGL